MIIDWEEIADERSGELDQLRAIRRYTRSFRIITDCIHDGPETILMNAEFLGLLSIYVEAKGTDGPCSLEAPVVDPGAILRTVRVNQPDKDNPYVWILTYEYSSEPLDPQQRGVSDPSNGGSGGGDGGGGDNSPKGQGVQDPLSRPPIFSFDAAEYQKAMNVDALGAAVTNSAGAPFSPLPEVDDTRFVLTMERNEKEPNWALLLSYQDAVNSDYFLGFLPGTAKVKIRAQSMFENNIYYWKVTYIWQFRSYVNIQGTLYSGWDSHPIDQGYYYLDSKGNTRSNFDPSGNPITEPILLDGKGHAATGGVTAVYVTAPGTGYTGKVPLVFTGGGGSGASGYGIGTGDGLTGPGGGGPITAVVVTNPGSGYTTAPTVTVYGGLGSGATFSAVIGPRPVFRHFRPYNWLPFAVFTLPKTIS